MNHRHQIFSLEDIHDHVESQMLPSSNFDPASSHDDFLDQVLSSVIPSSADFPWPGDQPPDMVANTGRHLQPQISNAKTLMLQRQLLLSTGLDGGANGGHMPQDNQSDVVNASISSNSANLLNAASIRDYLNGFAGSFGPPSNQFQHFHQSQQNFGAPATVSGSSRGGATGQPKQRVRARRGQATDPHSIAERLRRERIAERMKSLQELVPNANKTDKASMLDEIIDYVKFLQLQVKVLSMSRLGGASAVAPLDKSLEGNGGNKTNTADSSRMTTVAERQVGKLMEEDMGSALQYLESKGLCLMPISLATSISAVTSRSARNTLTNGGSTSPSISTLTVQSATTAREVSLKDVPKLE